MNIFSRKKTALVLGGGGARGLCNIGILKVLEKHYGRDKMPFDMIVGTSIGSMIGAAYCLGVSLELIEEKARKFGWQHIFDFGFPSSGVVKGDRFEQIIKDVVDDRGFEDMKIPFALTTTNLDTGEGGFHTSGPLIPLIRASCSWPGVFAAVEIDGEFLVDGGVKNSIPTKVAKEMGADSILAVNPGFSVQRMPVKTILKSLIQAVQIMGEELNEYQAKIADIIIKPHLEAIDQFDFDKAGEIIKKGEAAAEAQLPEIKKKLRA